MANSILAPTWKRAQMGSTGGPIDLDTDPIYILLVNSTYTALSDATKKTHDFIDDVQPNQITGTGYTAGGVLLTGAVIASDGADGYKLNFTTPTWATATITATGAVLYKRVGADLTTPTDDPIIGYWDFGASISSTAGTFTATVPAGGVLVLP